MEARRSKATPPGGKAAYLNKLHPAVRNHFVTSTSLRTFLARAGRLTARQRTLIVRQALILLEQNYVHLPMKRAMHAVDPVRRLKVLLQRLESAGERPSEAEFHSELMDTFHSLRDVHTRYLLPEPYNCMVAFLPFRVEDYGDGDRRKYIVASVSDGFDHQTFVPGVEIVHWNGVPIDRAVWSHAQRFAGSNRDARHARGLVTLTHRPLHVAPPPDEEWVKVGYMTKGELAERRFVWQVVRDPSPRCNPGRRTKAAADEESAIDLELAIIKRMHLALFAPRAVAKAKEAARGKTLKDLESSLPLVFTAHLAGTPSGTFGYLRIWSFDEEDLDKFVDEFIRLIQLLPQNGLIIDVRANGGGKMSNGEVILQTLTPRRIEPEPVQFLNTPLNLEICRSRKPSPQSPDLKPWVESIKEGLQIGAGYSAAFPKSDPEQCNARGQKYFGPVVLITDALSYSATDMFAAGFQDHEIGPILGTDSRTGAGGANMWEHEKFVAYKLPGRVYEPLPKGAQLRVAIRRSLRVGRQAGAVLEDFGVKADKHHRMTRNDVLNNNEDLIDHAGSLLAGLPVRALTATIKLESRTEATVVARAQGMNRLDIYVDDRPIKSIDLERGQATFVVEKPVTPKPCLEIRGFDRAELVARYRTPI